MPAECPTSRADRVLESLMGRVRAHFPGAQFAWRQAPDGSRYYLDVAAGTDDDFAILDIVAAATVEAFLEDQIMVHVFPFRKLPD